MTAAGALRPLPVYYAAKPPVVELPLDFPCNSQGLRAPAAPAAVLAAAGGSRRGPRGRGARVSCRPCSCGRQPGCAEAFLSVSFVFPSLLSRFRRGSAPFQRESMGGASRARKSAVSGQQSAFWHGASPSWGAPERFHREPNSPTWAFPGRGHPPASREGGVACQSAVSWPKIGDFRARSGACSDGASLSVALESAEKGARFKRKDGEGRSPRTEGRGGALALSEGAGRGRARARLRVGVRGETRRRLRRLPGCALRCGGLSPRPAEGTLRAAMGAFGIVRVAAILVPSGGFGCCRKKGGDGV